MPPKPAKGKDDKKKEEPEVDDGAERELVEKELVIGYLKSKLGRYQENGDRLQVDNLKLNDELETQKLNLRDINEFLTNELKARSLTTSALEAKVQEMNHILDDVHQKHEDQTKALIKAKGEEISELESQLAEFKKKAKTTQDFLEKKDEIEAELAQLRTELSKKVKEYEQRLTDMDRQHIQDREKWKRDTAAKIKETKIQMMKLTDNQLEMTTKRTIMENEQMSIELSYQSRQTEKLLRKNTQLLDENSDLRRQLELSKQTEEELAKRNNVYQKTIKSLLTKLKDQSQEQKESGSMVSEMDQALMELESQLHLSQLQNDEMQDQLMQARSQLSAQASELGHWATRYDATAKFLMRCMDDVQASVITIVRDESVYMDEPEVTLIPGNLDDLSAVQRERVLGYLLEKLHVFVRNLHLQDGGKSPTSKPSALGRQFNNAQGAVGGDPLSPTTTLPPIPSFSRRNPLEAKPMGQALGASKTGGVVASMGGGVGLEQGHASTDLSASWPQPGVPQTTGIRTLAPEMQKADLEAMQEALPPVDELLSKVMSNVRPWGNRSQGQPLSLGKNGVFLRKGGNTGNVSKSYQK